MGDKEPFVDDSRYRLLVESIIDYAVYLLDLNGNVASWNPGAQRFKGYTADEIIGQNFSRFYTPEDQASGLPQRALKIAVEEGRYESEGWRMRKDGSRFWTHVVMDAVRDSSKDVIGFAKITRDLTERKATESALRRSEQQFRLLVEGVTDYAIYMLDPDGFVSSWNQGAERIKGYTAEEIIGHHFSSFYPEEDRKRGLPEAGLLAAATHGRFEMEGWRVRKDGTPFFAHVIIDAIRENNGELIGYAKITRDITERRESQRALEEAREALFQSQKLEAIGQLTGGVAHDFNNLLTVIQSSLEMIRRRLPDDARLGALIDNAAQAADRGATLTQRMLSFARKQSLDRTIVDIPTLVRGMSNLLARALGPTIRIETQFPSALSPVNTDANQLETALLNLAVNARDAMPNGGQLTIAARDEDLKTGNPLNLPAGRYIHFSVGDEGAGMDATTLARAVEPFYTTKGVGKGTGLGLSMVQGLAEQSGGRLVLESQPGVGTIAAIWLPASEAQSEAATPKAPEPDAVPAPLAGLRVLAVDDDGLVLMNTVAMLEELGHTVFEAVTGTNALDILEQQNGAFDLVITDQAMPFMTGTELVEKIKAKWPEMPVIMASGYSELPALNSGYIARISKPFLEKDLSDAIAIAMKSGR